MHNFEEIKTVIKMSPNEKNAAARVISDIIKADSIIEKSEMEKLGALRKKFDIRPEHLQRGQGMTFSEALTVLRGMDKRSVGRFIKDLYDLSISDGSCCPKEAQLISAIKYCFEKDLCDHSDVFSCNTKDFNITSDQYVVYVESKKDPKTNKEIRSNLARIVNALKVIGFDFIYIPKLVDEFKAMSEEYVKDVIHYMAPQLNRDTTVQEIYKRMCSLTTYEFCQKVLCEENKVDIIKDTEPALLVSVGNSIVPYVDAVGICHSYMEFLKIRIKDSVVDEIRQFCDIFQGLVDERVIVTPKSRIDNFKYFGFYKALLDFLVSGGNNEESKILIDLQARRVAIQNRPGISIHLSRDKMLMLFLLVHQNIFNDGVVYTKDHFGKVGFDPFLNDLVEDILNILGAPEFGDEKRNRFFENFPVTLSKLKKDLSSERQLPELVSLIPKKTCERSHGKDIITYKVNLNPEMIMVKDYTEVKHRIWKERRPDYIPISEMLLK